MDFRLCLYVIAFVFSLGLEAQIDLKGYVIDDGTGQPIPQINVFDTNSGQETRSDAKGFFKLKALEIGEHTIVFYNETYSWVERTFTLDATTHLDIRLTKTNSLSEVVVQAKKKEYFDLKRLQDVVGTTIYAGKKNEVILVDQIIGNKSSGNARQIYAQIAGLNIYESTNCGLQLAIGGRGLDPNRTSNFNTRQNGYDISADVLGYPESYYTPPAEALEQIQIIRGAASLQYGTQFGGLINFKLKQPSQKPFELISRQSYDTNCGCSSFNSFSGTLNKFSYYAYVGYKNNLNQAPRPNMDLESVNLFANLNYQISEKTKIGFELTHLGYTTQQPGGLTDRMFYENPDQSNRTRNWFRVNWNLITMDLSHQFSQNSRLNLIAWGANSSRDAIGFRTNRVSQLDDLENPEPRDLQKGDFRNWGAELRYLTNYKIGKRKSTLLIGGKYYQAYNSERQGPGSIGSNDNFNFVTYEVNDLPTELRQSDFDFPNFNTSFFGENIFYISPKFSVTPGIRFEYIKTESEGIYRSLNRDLAGNPLLDTTFEDSNIFERSFLLLGLGVSCKPNTTLEVYGSLSQNYRSVTFSDIRIVNPTFQIDPNITDEEGYTVDLGLRGRYHKLLSYDTNIFGLYYDNRIGEVLRPETRIDANGEIIETGRVLRFRANIGRAFMYGLESLIDLNLKPFVFSNIPKYKLNLYTNFAFTKSKYLDSEEPGVEDNEVEFVPALNLRTGVKFGYKNFLADLQFSYLSDQFTDASNAPQDRRDSQSGIKGTIPSYSVWDLSFSYRYKKLTLETGVNNLFNSRYFTQRATGYPGPGIIPALPRSFYTTLQLKL